MYQSKGCIFGLFKKAVPPPSISIIGDTNPNYNHLTHNSMETDWSQTKPEMSEPIKLIPDKLAESIADNYAPIPVCYV